MSRQMKNERNSVELCAQIAERDDDSQDQRDREKGHLPSQPVATTPVALISIKSFSFASDVVSPIVAIRPQEARIQESARPIRFSRGRGRLVRPKTASLINQVGCRHASLSAQVFHHHQCLSWIEKAQSFLGLWEGENQGLS